MKKILFVILVLIEFGFCQTPSDDFFPLAVGNTWTYNYSTSSSSLKDEYYYSDSGTAIYSITSKVLTNDSTVWGCVEVRDIVHHFYSPQQNSTDTLRDTTEFSKG